MASALMNVADWAQAEFSGADLGDARRSRRLIKVAEGLARNPRGLLPQVFDKWAELKAAYNLFEERDVTYEAIMAPHITRVREECRAAGDYLFVEDTTDLDFTSHHAAKDLGPIGDGDGRGLFVHSTLAMRVEGWNAENEPEVIIAGLSGQKCWARKGKKTGIAKENKQKRLSRDRESQRWAALVEQIGPPGPGSRYTFIADREADIFETIERCQDKGWDFIVRANQPRALADADGSVFDAVAAAPIIARFSIDLRTRPKRVTRDKQTGKPKRIIAAHKARTVQLVVRSCTVCLRGPWRPKGTPESRTVNVVEVKEVNPPAGSDPIHWVLLTSWPCGTQKEAIRVVKAYSRRWVIEEYHKALKTGTGIEDSQLEAAHSIMALLGILAVTAVRLLNRKLLAAAHPNEPIDRQEVGPEVIQVLQAVFGRPTGGWTNREFVRCVARLGGFIGRKSDGEPGWITIWRGWNRLMTMVIGFNFAKGQKCG